MDTKKICPLDYEYDKYFLKNTTLVKSAISDFFFFEGEEAFNKEFDKVQSYVDDLLKRADELRRRKIKERGK